MGKSRVRIRIVDPPSGWLYGWPKIFDETKPYEQQLREGGYPEELIPLALKASRYWFE